LADFSPFPDFPAALGDALSPPTGGKDSD